MLGMPVTVVEVVHVAAVLLSLVAAVFPVSVLGLGVLGRGVICHDHPLL
jgi:hypothetical protein